MMRIFALVLCFGLANCQTVNNVRVVDHVPYMINVLQEVVSEVEHREWCNLKVPDITAYINETVIDREYAGTVTYSNGFLATMQHVDMLTGVDQIWSWHTDDQTASVMTRATLRFHDVSIGYDVVAELMDGNHRYTVTVTYPMVTFVFSLHRNVYTDVVTTEVVGTITTTATIRTMKYFPTDDTTDVLSSLFSISVLGDSIRAWADVFNPIAYHVASEVVEFPTICYDCPT